MSVVVTPSGGDDTAAIQAAINSLPASGGEVVLTAGLYHISDTIHIGNGNASQHSTRSGVKLRGEGVSAWGPSPTYPAGNEPGAVILWTPSTFNPMVQVEGPLEGWGLENITLKGNWVAWGLQVLGAQFGDCRNVVIRDCPRGIQGSPVGELNSTHNSFRNTGVWLPYVDGAMAINLGGTRTPTSAGANCCFWSFDHTTIVLAPNVSTYGIYLGWCDTNLWTHTQIIGVSTIGCGVMFDNGTSINGTPNSNGFVDIDCAVKFPIATSGFAPPADFPNNWVDSYSIGNGGTPLPVLPGVIFRERDTVADGLVTIRGHKPVTGEAGMLLAINRNGSTVLSQVKIGATNSGGSGKRALVVDN